MEHEILKIYKISDLSSLIKAIRRRNKIPIATIINKLDISRTTYYRYEQKGEADSMSVQQLVILDSVFELPKGTLLTAQYRFQSGADITDEPELIKVITAKLGYKNRNDDISKSISRLIERIPDDLDNGTTLRALLKQCLVLLK